MGFEADRVEKVQKLAYHIRFSEKCLTKKFIMKTCPCNADPLTPHFYIVKLGFTGVYIIFLFLL